MSDALLPFQLKDVIDTGIVVGDGSYATVKLLDFRGLKCVGKKLHALLYELANPRERADMLQRFAGECELLSRLHHPCIVQFLGVYFEQDRSQLPVMVMEYLHTTLAECLKNYGILPKMISYPILRDVVLGLRYLHEHSPPIVHRDLSANNVLLTADMNAKISDLGVAKILNLTPAQITQRISTQTPGTPCYMPPETLVSNPSYTSKIDNYSYGVLMIHTLCGRWPFPGSAFRDDPLNPGSFIPVSEVDRREEYLHEIGLDHPLMGLIRRCLSNTPTSRPEASEILRLVAAVLSSLPSSTGNKIEMIRRMDAQIDSQEVNALRSEVESQRREIEILRSEVESKSKENDDQKEEISSLRKQILSPPPKPPIDELPISSLPHPHSLEQSAPPPTPATAEQPTPPPLPPRAKDDQSKAVRARAKLQWRQCADLPMKMANSQSVLIGTTAYVGGGNADRLDEQFIVCQYDPRRDGWDSLPPCAVRWFALGQFQGHLITVGGDTRQGVTTAKLYHYKEESRKWKEFLKPMPTARCYLSIITTQSAIIACGGINRSDAKFAVVEVYTTEADQWHVADALPIPFFAMTSITISDTCYLLGGNGRTKLAVKSVLSAPVSSLVESAQRRSQGVFSGYVWKTLTPTPLLASAAASLGGYLLALGGCQGQYQACSEVHMLVPHATSWVKMDSGDLPAAVYTTSAIQLADGNKLLVCGGRDNKQKMTSVAYIGSMVDM